MQELHHLSDARRVVIGQPLLRTPVGTLRTTAPYFLHWSLLRSSRALAPILQGIAGHQPAVRSCWARWSILEPSRVDEQERHPIPPMTTDGSRGTHVSRYFASLRLARGLRPSELAILLGASNVHKVGSLIRNYELSGDINDHWFLRLCEELRPDLELIRHYQSIDDTEAEARARIRTEEEAELERRRRAAWAKQLPQISCIRVVRETRRCYAAGPLSRLPSDAGSLAEAQAFALSLLPTLPPDNDDYYFYVKLYWSLDQTFRYQRDSVQSESA